MSADALALRPRTSEVLPAAAARAQASARAQTGFWESVLRVPALALVGLIRVYQYTLSPALPLITLGRCGCRFSPTCSHYAADAIRLHGAGRGTYLAAVRLLKCTPLHPGGLDPVPRRTMPECRRAPISSLTSQPGAH